MIGDCNCFLFGHFSTMKYIFTLNVIYCKAPRDENLDKSQFLISTSSPHTHTQYRRNYTGVFNIQSLDELLLPWNGHLLDLGSVIPMRVCMCIQWPACALTDRLLIPSPQWSKESISVMAKHSSASRHLQGFTGSMWIQLCPRWLRRQRYCLLLIT